MTSAAAPLTPKKRARRIAVLRRRAEHLEQRVAADPYRPAHHDRSEAKALRWAIEELEHPAQKDQQQ